MNYDRQMDRLVRSLQLCLKSPKPKRPERRITAAKMGAYVKALEERDDAKNALAAAPEDSAAQEVLRKAQEVLDRVRDTLKR